MAEEVQVEQAQPSIAEANMIAQGITSDGRGNTLSPAWQSQAQDYARMLAEQQQWQQQDAERNLTNHEAISSDLQQTYQQLAPQYNPDRSFTAEFVKQTAQGVNPISSLFSAIGAGFGMDWWRERYDKAYARKLIEYQKGANYIAGTQNEARAKLAMDAANTAKANETKFISDTRMSNPDAYRAQIEAARDADTAANQANAAKNRLEQQYMTENGKAILENRKGALDLSTLKNKLDASGTQALIEYNDRNRETIAATMDAQAEAARIKADNDVRAQLSYDFNAGKAVAQTTDNGLAQAVPDENARKHITANTPYGQQLYTLNRFVYIADGVSKGNKYAVDVMLKDIVPSISAAGYEIIQGKDSRWQIRDKNGNTLDVNKDNLLKMRDAILGNVKKEAEAYAALHNFNEGVPQFYFNATINDETVPGRKEWCGQKLPSDIYSIVQGVKGMYDTPEWNEAIARAMTIKVLEKLPVMENLTDQDRWHLVFQLKSLMPMLGLSLRDPNSVDMQFITRDGQLINGTDRLMLYLKKVDADSPLSFDRELNMRLNAAMQQDIQKIAENRIKAAQDLAKMQKTQLDIEAAKLDVEKKRLEVDEKLGKTSGTYPSGIKFDADSGEAVVDMPVEAKDKDGKVVKTTQQVRIWNTDDPSLATMPGHRSDGTVANADSALDIRSGAGNLTTNKELTKAAYGFKRLFMPEKTTATAAAELIPVYMTSIEGIAKYARADYNLPGGIDLMAIPESEVRDGVATERAEFEKHGMELDKDGGVWQQVEEARKAMREFADLDNKLQGEQRLLKSLKKVNHIYENSKVPASIYYGPEQNQNSIYQQIASTEDSIKQLKKDKEAKLKVYRDCVDKIKQIKTARMSAQ